MTIKTKFWINMFVFAVLAILMITQSMTPDPGYDINVHWNGH